MNSSDRLKGYIFLLPTIENHFFNFTPLLEPLKSLGLIVKLLIVDSAIPGNRKFNIDDEVRNDCLHIVLSELENLINQIGNSKCFLLVGNDSEPVICEIIRKFKSKKHKIILVQDGWLEAQNINNPIYSKERIFTNVKKEIHKFLTKPWIPTKKYIHNFIGQNADYFFVYSEIAKNNFIESGVNNENIFITGSPRHALIRESQKGLNRTRAVALFSTVTNNELELAIVKKKIEWIKEIYPHKLLLIKLHPSENDLKYRDLINSSGIEMTRSSIVDIIKNFDIEMSFCFASTVVFDMLILSVPVIQLLMDEFEWKYVNYFHDLPIVMSKGNLKVEIENLNIENLKQIGSRYLIDIDPTKNSVDLTINTINTLLA